MKCQYYVTDSPRYTDCKPCSKFRLYTSGRCKNCVFNIPTFFKVFLEQYFHSQVLFRTDYFIMTLRAYYVVPNWHVRCNNTNLHVTFKYTNIPFWALKCALANYAPPILCFLSLPHEHSMTSMLNFIPNVMRQASLSLRPPIIAPHPSARILLHGSRNRQGHGLGTHRAPVTGCGDSTFENILWLATAPRHATALY